MSIDNFFKKAGGFLLGHKPSNKKVRYLGDVVSDAQQELSVRLFAAKTAAVATFATAIAVLAADDVVSSLMETPPHAKFIGVATAILTPIAARVAAEWTVSSRRKHLQVNNQYVS